jgi:hypothetical protein
MINTLTFSLIIFFTLLKYLISSESKYFYKLYTLPKTHDYLYRFTEQEEHIDVSSLFGNSSSLNYYFVDTYFGEPPQKQSLIVDTGSSATAVPCKTICTHCGTHLNQYYDFTSKN